MVTAFVYFHSVEVVKPSDAPAAIVMGAGFFAFGLTMILRPENVRASFDRFADAWKQGSWHPYKLSTWAMRLAGTVVLGIALLFFYIAYIGLRE